MRPSNRSIIIPPTRIGADFDVSSIAGPNLLGWYRGDRVYKDGNGKMMVWPNLGLLGPSHDLLQTDASKQPLYVDEAINGWPAVRGNGVDQLMSIANATFFQAKLESTIIIIAKRSDASVSVHTFPFMASTGTSSTTFRVREWWASNNRHYLNGLRDDANSTAGSTPITQQQNDNYLFYRNRFASMCSLIGWNATYGETFINGWRSAIKTNFMTFNSGGSSNTASQVLNIFYDPLDNVYFQGDIAEICIWNKKLTSTEKAAVLNGLGAKYNLPCWDTCTNYLIYEGSSTINGTNSSGIHEDRIPQRVWATLGFPRNHLWHNDGQTNKLTSDMLVDAESRVENLPVGIAGPLNTLPLPPNVSRDKAILIVQPASNDIANGDSAATAYAAVKPLLNSYYQAGYRRIALLPPQPRTNGTVTAQILSLGNLYRSNLDADLLADYSIPTGSIKLIDIQLLPQFDADGDYNNTTYYNADKVHLSAVAGNQLFAETIVARLQSFGWLS